MTFFKKIVSLFKTRRPKLGAPSVSAGAPMPGGREMDARGDIRKVRP